MRRFVIVVAVLCVLAAHSAHAFVDYSKYVLAVQAGAKKVYEQDNVSLNNAKVATAKMGSGVLYVIQWDEATVCNHVYVGETINNLHKRYGKLTTGLKGVIADKDDATDVRITVFNNWDATKRQDETVAKAILNDAALAATTCVENIRGMKFFFKQLHAHLSSPTEKAPASSAEVLAPVA